MCLRGNWQRHRHEAVIVDFLNDGKFHIARMSGCGTDILRPELTEGLLPWIPRCPPEKPPNMPPSTRLAVTKFWENWAAAGWALSIECDTVSWAVIRR